MGSYLRKVIRRASQLIKNVEDIPSTMAKIEQNVGKVVEETVLSSEKRLEGELAEVRRLIHHKSVYQRLLEFGAIFSTAVSAHTLNKDLAKTENGSGGLETQALHPKRPTGSILDIYKIEKREEEPAVLDDQEGVSIMGVPLQSSPPNPKSLTAISDLKGFASSQLEDIKRSLIDGPHSEVLKDLEAYQSRSTSASRSQGSLEASCLLLAHTKPCFLTCLHTTYSWQQVKAERLKARAREKCANKLAATRRIAEEKRANIEAKLNEKAMRTCERADYIRRTGHKSSILIFLQIWQEPSQYELEGGKGEHQMYWQPLKMVLLFSQWKRPATAARIVSVLQIHYIGYTFPAGWIILACTPALHLNPDKYEDPLTFNPWRWKGRELSVGSKFFMGFGSGARLCDGAEFVKLQMSIFLHHSVTKYWWTVIKEGVALRQPGLVFPEGFHIQILNKNAMNMLQHGGDTKPLKIFICTYLHLASIYEPSNVHSFLCNQAKDDSGNVTRRICICNSSSICRRCCREFSASDRIDHQGISNVAPADAPLRSLPIPKAESGLELKTSNPVVEAIRIHDCISNLRFSISPTAFFQVNTLAAEKLYSRTNMIVPVPQHIVLILSSILDKTILTMLLLEAFYVVDVNY
ncbi:Cytochrome P450 [Corchorus capsularis]|uniref:Cytochrome P450 n=1 Tax=Corchorus capsularis TaxID=210143 RepID=A0A1R3GGD2_COCAP|nr:Cytochrome P450 [Corchorus capsularis]